MNGKWDTKMGDARVSTSLRLRWQPLHTALLVGIVFCCATGPAYGWPVWGSTYDQAISERDEAVRERDEARQERDRAIEAHFVDLKQENPAATKTIEDLQGQLRGLEEELANAGKDRGQITSYAWTLPPIFGIVGLIVGLAIGTKAWADFRRQHAANSPDIAAIK